MTTALHGQKAIVTGGSRGIGRAIVLRLAEQGAHVLFSFRDNEAAARAVEADVRARGGLALGVRADLTDLGAVRQLFAVIPERFGGRPDLYVGNAFPEAVFAPTALMTETGYDGMFSAVRGHYFALQEAARQLSDGGRMVVLSSGAAAAPQAASGAYAGAKAAIERFALSLAREVGERGVTVNVVSPGVTRTDGLVAPQAMIDGLVAQTPLGRLGEPDDVASAVAQLLTPSLGWVNGQVIQVNGGIL